MSDLSITSSAVTAITDWIVHKLGYPVVTVELQDTQLEYCLNEAVEQHSAIITEWAIENNIANALGLPSNQDFTRRWVGQDINFENTFAEAYSMQAGVGGKAPFRKDYFTLSADVQTYQIPSGRNVHEIMWADPPAMIGYSLDFYDDAYWVKQEFGWTVYGHPMDFLIPVYYSIQLGEHIELRNRIRSRERSYKVLPWTGGTQLAYIYPVPRSTDDTIKVWYFYVTDDDMNLYSGLSAGMCVSDPATIQYDEIPYSAFNSWSQRWVKNYALACAKEVLGRIRSKFGNVPIPDAEVALDGDKLLDEGKEEQNSLKEVLREKLKELKYAAMVEDDANMAENLNRSLSFNPLGIYVG